MTTALDNLPDALWIDGIAVSGTEMIEVRNPATLEPVGAAPTATSAQLDEAVAAARRAQPDWAADPEAVAIALTGAAEAITRAGSRLAKLITLEQGKPRMVAMGEVMAAAAAFRWAATAVTGGEETMRSGRDAVVTMARRPHGVVAAITPWNFPLAIAAAKIAPALAARNTVVLKPSPATPLTTLELASTVSSWLPAGVLNVVTGGDEVGGALVTHDGVDHVSLTGSSATGRWVASRLGERLRGATLELGGNDAAIVLPDADPAALASDLVAQSFANAGQACLLIKRLLVPRSLHDDLVAAMSAHVRGFVTGDGMAPGTTMGPLTTAAQRDRVASLQHAAVADGATVAAAGDLTDLPGHFHAPTLLVGARPGMDVVDEEQFGPVLPVITYDDVDEAVAIANGTSYGLGGSVWSPDVERAAEVGGRLACGMVWVNTHARFGPDDPLVPWNASGTGAENGLMGLMQFTRAQVCVLPPGTSRKGAHDG